MSDPDTLLTLVAHEALEASLEDLREMESVLIDIEPEKEALVPRPDPPEDIAAEAAEILERAGEELLEPYRESVPESGAIGRMLKMAAEEHDRVDAAAIERAVDAAAGPTAAAEDGADPATGEGPPDDAPVATDPSDGFVDASESVEDLFVGADGGRGPAAEPTREGGSVADLFDDPPGGDADDTGEEVE